MELYNLEFKVVGDSIYTEFTGFENTKTAEFFEAGWNMPLLFHDIFEHFFEDSKYFGTEQLSVAGECVAMGMREYFYEHTDFIEKFASYNKYMGVQTNSIETIKGLYEEGEEEWTRYPNDFNYYHLPEWPKENLFSGLFDIEDIELAMSYGYWLAERLFSDKLDMIEKFCENLNEFLQLTEIGNTDIFNIPDMYPDVVGNTLKVSVCDDIITANLCNITITSEEQDIDKLLEEFNQHFGYELEID